MDLVIIYFVQTSELFSLITVNWKTDILQWVSERKENIRFNYSGDFLELRKD